jgi:hypothetical protein
MVSPGPQPCARPESSALRLPTSPNRPCLAGPQSPAAPYCLASPTPRRLCALAIPLVMPARPSPHCRSNAGRTVQPTLRLLRDQGLPEPALLGRLASLAGRLQRWQGQHPGRRADVRGGAGQHHLPQAGPLCQHGPFRRCPTSPAMPTSPMRISSNSRVPAASNWPASTTVSTGSRGGAGIAERPAVTNRHDH